MVKILGSVPTGVTFCCLIFFHASDANIIVIANSECFWKTSRTLADDM